MIDKYVRVTVRRIVADFYNSVLTSRRLAPYFEDIDIQGLVNHQSAFLAAVMGGSPSHDGRSIERAHTGLGVTENDFLEMIRLLEKSLREHDVAPEDVETLTDRYLDYREAVVSDGSSSGG